MVNRAKFQAQILDRLGSGDGMVDFPGLKQYLNTDFATYTKPVAIIMTPCNRINPQPNLLMFLDQVTQLAEKIETIFGERELPVANLRVAIQETLCLSPTTPLGLTNFCKLGHRLVKSYFSTIPFRADATAYDGLWQDYGLKTGLCIHTRIGGSRR